MVEKESGRVPKEFNQAAEEFCRLQLLCKSARLLCGLTGKEFGQAELLSGRAKLLGKRVGIFPGVCYIAAEARNNQSRSCGFFGMTHSTQFRL
ncbi:hypothetical protein [Candidatus Electronema sp. PJ]|uniref:hypothetical protein n=1 Tax=Candidatus Electronema sp. PJ TaxID=3401572 RepID=UPI003AA984CF